MAQYGQGNEVNVFQANEAKLIFEHAQRLTSPIDPIPIGYNGTPAVMVPKDWKLESLPGWEPPLPQRIRTKVAVTDARSFIEYFKLYSVPATDPNCRSAIFADVTNTGAQFVGVLDYHAAEAQWCGHRVEFQPALSEDWKRWMEMNRQPKTQMELALFLEDNLAACLVPAGADLLEMINTLAVDESITFRSAQRLQSGAVRFHYDSESKARAGEVEMPSELQVGLPVFDGQVEAVVRFRLKYRLSNGAFKLWLEAVNPHKVMDWAVKRMQQEIEEGTGVQAYRGKLL